VTKPSDSSVSVTQIKDFTWKIELRLPRHVVPYAVKDDFPSKDAAEGWLASNEGKTTIDAIRAREKTRALRR